jgi:hypothetical protein
VPLPTTCPHGGFQFAAQLTFLDGSTATAHTAVPCPGSPRGQRSDVPRAPRAQPAPPR